MTKNDTSLIERMKSAMVYSRCSEPTRRIWSSALWTGGRSVL
jgi:hypothetical protein